MRSSSARARVAASLAAASSTPLKRLDQPGAERPQHPSIGGGQPTRRQGEQVVLPQLEPLTLGRNRRRVKAVHGDDAPAAIALTDEDCGSDLAERDAQMGEQHPHRVVLADIGPDHVDEGLRFSTPGLHRPCAGPFGRRAG